MLKSVNNVRTLHQQFLQTTMYSSMLLASTCLLLTQLSSSSSLLSSISSSSSSDNQNSTHPSTQQRDNEMRLFDHFNEPYTYRLHGQLRIGIGEITTSSIKLTWHLSNKTYKDSVIESQVLCETFSGTIVSKKIVSSNGSHRIEGLDSDSKYILCVYMLEKSAKSNVTVLHFNCHNGATIPVLRSDSIIGVLLTLGYIFLMAAIGYFMWKKKAREINEDRIRINVDDDDDDEYEDEEDDIGTVGRGGVPSRGGKNNTTASKKSMEKRNDSVGALNPAVDTTTVRLGNGQGDGTNGRMDFSKNRESPPNSRLCGLAQAEMEDRRPKSQSIEDSPVKVTEIAF